MILNDYLNIKNYGSKEFEYKISFKDEAEFYKDIKDQEELYWWFGDGINECDIELANIVAGFIRPHLPPYTKLILQTIYLKYQRQERPTMDCRASLLQSYINQFNYDFIEVPYLHGEDTAQKHYKNIIIYNFAEIFGKVHYFCDEITILPDNGALKLMTKEENTWTDYENYYQQEREKIIICRKERTDEGIKTVMPKIKAQGNKFAIVDDIIAGGDSIINVLKLLREQKPEAKITIHCIFLMSQYGYDNIKKQCGDIKIKPIFDLRNKIDNPFK